MNGAIVSKIHAARVELRDRGENETYEAINALTGCSKTTIKKYWDASDPATYASAGSAGSQETPAPANLPPMAREELRPVNGAAHPVAPTDMDFEASFERLMVARTRFFVCQEILGDSPTAEHFRTVALRKGVHGLWSDHPLIQRIVDEYDQAYDDHLDLWKQMVPPSQYAYHGWRAPVQAPEPEPVPVPAPAPLSLENLERYYRNRFESPWPDGAPLTATTEVYALLKQLRTHCGDGMAQAQIEQRRLQNEHRRRGREGDDDPAVIAEGQKRSMFMTMSHAIDNDQGRLRSRARDEGRTLE